MPDLLTPKKTLIDFEQVVPVLPQGIFSVITRKVPLAVPLFPQWSWEERRLKIYYFAGHGQDYISSAVANDQ